MIRRYASFLLALMATLQLHAGELDERARLTNEIVTLLNAERFVDLDRIADDYRSNGQRTPSGLWKLTIFYAGVNNVASSCRDKPRGPDVEGKTQRWMAQNPNSPTAINAHAMFLVQHGWAYRGCGWASEVKEEDWKPFYEYVGKARAHLLAHKKIGERDPRWYETMLVIARSEGWDQAKFQALVDEAVAKHPYFYQIYFAAIDYLTPKWHGDKRKIEEFANYAVDKTRTSEQTGMYARVYWYASQAQYGSRLFTDSAVVWPRMKQGIEDVLARYPDQWNLNNFAQFACQAGDQAMTQQLIRKIDVPMPAVWREPQNHSSRTQPLGYEACKNGQINPPAVAPR